MEYIIHAFVVTRVAQKIEADSAQKAVMKVGNETNLHQILDRGDLRKGSEIEVEYAEEIREFISDEPADNPNYAKSQCWTWEGKPI